MRRTEDGGREGEEEARIQNQKQKHHMSMWELYIYSLMNMIMILFYLTNYRTSILAILILNLTLSVLFHLIFNS